MNPRSLLGAVAFAVLTLTAGVVVLKGDEQPIAVQEKCDRPAMLAKDSDGGRAYVCDVIVDSGLDCTRTQAPEECQPTFMYERRRLTQSTHVRARSNDGTCLIREPLPGIDAGFKTPRYFGAGNRFPRAWAVGAGCEEVAGLVTDKADSDVDETELLQRDAGKEGASK